MTTFLVPTAPAREKGLENDTSHFRFEHTHTPQCQAREDLDLKIHSESTPFQLAGSSGSSSA
ncbi:MAG: hypothetical protein V3U88_06605 [Methylococcales bacterium]